MPCIGYDLELIPGTSGKSEQELISKAAMWYSGKDSIYGGSHPSGNEVQRKPREEGVEFSHSLRPEHF